MQEALARTVGLNPFAIDHELGNRPFADVLDDFLGGPGGGLDIDLGVGDLVLIEKRLASRQSRHHDAE